MILFIYKQSALDNTVFDDKDFDDNHSNGFNQARYFSIFKFFFN